MKNRVVCISKKQATKWISIANSFAKSLCPSDVALQQFNRLSSKDRCEIKRRFEECDKIRVTKIPKGEEHAWLLGVMVDAHIIATLFDVDPLAVTMCLCALCKPNEHIVVK